MKKFLLGCPDTKSERTKKQSWLSSFFSVIFGFKNDREIVDCWCNMQVQNSLKVALSNINEHVSAKYKIYVHPCHELYLNNQENNYFIVKKFYIVFKRKADEDKFVKYFGEQILEAVMPKNDDYSEDYLLKVNENGTFEF